MIRRSPPFCVKVRSSSMISRSPLHLMKDTSISIRLQDTISFLSSVYICGSWTAPVNRLDWAIEVSGRMTAAFSSSARILFCRSNSARSCSARSATESASKSASLVSAMMVVMIRFASATWEVRSPPSSLRFSSPRSTTSATYFASTLDASAVSIGAVSLCLSNPASIVSSSLLITCSYSPSCSILFSSMNQQK